MPSSDPLMLEFLEEFTPPPKLPEVDEAVRATVQKVAGEYQRRQERKAVDVAEEEAKMGAARKELAGSILPSWRAYGVAAGAPIVSVAARILGRGGYADEAIRAAARTEQAQREREEGGVVPDILQRGARGALASYTQMAGAGMVAGPYGAISAAAIQQGNQSITEGKDAGKKGQELAEYAIAKGVWEGLPATVMQKAGLGGFEKIFNKKATSDAVSIGLRQGLKRLGITAAEEFFEENLTEVVHLGIDDVLKTDPGAFTLDRITKTVAETTVQTGIMVGFGGAPNVARSVQTGKMARTSEEIQAYARKGEIPSRKTWRKWDLAPEVGLSRAQRKAFIQEVAKQLEPTPEVVEPTAEAPPVAPEGPEGTILAPEITAEVPMAPEGIETGAEPEAVQEAPGAATMSPEMQKLAEDAGAPPLDPMRPLVEDEATALNKEGGARIREHVNLPALSDEAVQSWDVVMDRVVMEKADEKVLDIATEVMQTHRQVTTYEYEAMMLKVDKLLSDLKVQRARQAEAAEAGKKFSHKKASVQIETIAGQLDLITEASRHSRREIARALSVGQYRLNRESFDTADIIQRMQGARGPKKRLLKKQLAEAERRGSRHADLVEQVAKLEEENRLKDEQLEEALAGKVMEAKKPRGKAGRTRQARARAEREDIKKQIRQMGLRVNDIIGVSAEGTYLLGRLGITYIKEGVGTLSEVVDLLRSDVPDLNLTAQDVYQALIARSPKEIARAKKKNVSMVTELTSIARRLVKIDELSQGIASEVTTKPGESEERAQLRRMQTELQKRLRAETKLEEARRGEFPESKERLPDSPVISVIKEEIRKLQTIDRATKKVELAREGIFDAPRKKVPVTDEVKKLQEEYTVLRLEFYASDIAAAKKERAIETINRLQDQLDNGLTRLKESPKEIPPELADLQEQARQLRMEIGIDDALMKARDIRQQIKEGTYVPPPRKIKKPVNEKLERKQIELAKERREIRQMIADAAPWTAVKVGKEIAFTLKAVKATGDFSFVMRQNMWQVFSHPVLGAKAFGPAMKAFFREYSADQINNAIRNSENAFLYEQAGLAILDGESQDQAQRSEVFRARVIERIFGIGHVIRASGRHAAAFSNLMRTSAFDQFMDNHKEATQDQMRAFADYLNVSTGLGNLNKFGAVGDYLQVAFFSPKFAVSRVQTPWALVKYRKMPGVRKQIAKDMVKVVSTGGMVLALAAMAGADAEWLDPEDPDWGKIRIGNTRIDIWGGFQQPARLIARLSTGAFVKDFDPLEILGRFAAFKFAPIVTAPIELARGVTAVGEETTRLPTLDPLALGTVGRAFVPLVFEDIGDAWREEGAGAALGVGALAFSGVGVGTYKDSESAVRKEIKKLRGRGKPASAEKLRHWWNRENPDDQISRKWFLDTKK